jgi:hypothetical protein
MVFEAIGALKKDTEMKIVAKGFSFSLCRLLCKTWIKCWDDSSHEF